MKHEPELLDHVDMVATKLRDGEITDAVVIYRYQGDWTMIHGLSDVSGAIGALRIQTLRLERIALDAGDETQQREQAERATALLRAEGKLQ